MVTETPIENQEAQEAQEIGETPEAEEITEESPPVEAESIDEAPPPKRKPGRPKKNDSAAGAQSAPEAKAKPKAPKAPKPKARAPKAAPAQSAVVPVDPFRATLDTMSSAQLVAELVTRRRQTEREIKQNLYRSFVL
jgi:hypothetical protein